MYTHEINAMILVYFNVSVFMPGSEDGDCVVEMTEDGTSVSSDGIPCYLADGLPQTTFSVPPQVINQVLT